MFCRRFHFIRVCWSNIGRNNGVHMFTCEKQTEARTHNQRAGSKYRKKNHAIYLIEKIYHIRASMCSWCVCVDVMRRKKSFVCFLLLHFFPLFSANFLSLSLSSIARMSLVCCCYFSLPNGVVMICDRVGYKFIRTSILFVFVMLRYRTVRASHMP